MKNLIFISKNIRNYLVLALIGLLFLQSCKTYQKIDVKTTPLVNGKSYKIVIDDELEEVQLIAVKDSTASFNFHKTELQIPLKDIIQIRERKFSTSATVFTVIGSILLGSILGVVVILSIAFH